MPAYIEYICGIKFDGSEGIANQTAKFSSYTVTGMIIQAMTVIDNIEGLVYKVHV